MQINFIFSPIICHFVSSISVFLGNMSLTFNHGISSVSRRSLVIYRPVCVPYVSRVCQVSKRIDMRFLHFSSRFFCVYEINLVTLQRFLQNI